MTHWVVYAKSLDGYQCVALHVFSTEEYAQNWINRRQDAAELLGLKLELHSIYEPRTPENDADL